MTFQPSKYRKKPIVIEAVQLTRENIESVFLWTEAVVGAWTKPGVSIFESADGLLIPTLEGDMYANLGDYIIKGINGEFYPCKPDIFEKTYEQA